MKAAWWRWKKEKSFRRCRCSLSLSIREKIHASLRFPETGLYDRKKLKFLEGKMREYPDSAHAGSRESTVIPAIGRPSVIRNGMRYFRTFLFDASQRRKSSLIFDDDASVPLSTIGIATSTFPQSKDSSSGRSSARLSKINSSNTEDEERQIFRKLICDQCFL